jgi:hypothetical protein
LKLLRAGAAVVATTRFPNDAIDRYLAHDDCNDWKDRLHVYGLDLRDVTGIEAFARWLKLLYPNGIDVLVNNACQTVRRPVAFYAPLVQREQDLWAQGNETHRSLLMDCQAFERVRRRLAAEHEQQHGPMQEGPPRMQGLLTGNNADASNNGSQLETKPSDALAMVTTNGGDKNNHDMIQVGASFEETGLSHSAAMSQTIILPEDVGVSDDVLPPGVTDINGQQLDLRTSNSWLLKMEEVSTPEIMGTYCTSVCYYSLADIAV